MFYILNASLLLTMHNVNSSFCSNIHDFNSTLWCVYQFVHLNELVQQKQNGHFDTRTLYYMVTLPFYQDYERCFMCMYKYGGLFYL